MSLEEVHAYMKLKGWEIHLWNSIPYDGSPDIDYEDALYRQGLGEDSDDDNS